MKKLIIAILILFMLYAVAAAEELTRNTTDISVGDIITFGHYEQDNNLDNGAEPIEWIVLDVQDGKALLLSKYDWMSSRTIQNPQMSHGKPAP